MWIRSQDKSSISNVNSVYMNADFNIIGETNNSRIYLGTYPTKAKALKVLDMIQCDIESTNYYTVGNGFPIIRPKVFEMPLDSEV